MRLYIYALALSTVAPALWAQSVQSLTLINAETSQPIAGYNPIAPGATLNLATLPTRKLNVRINTSPATVGSVRTVYNGESRTENAAPYSMAGDTNGAYWAWTPSVGSLTITATAYSGANASGTAGAPYRLDLRVSDAAPSGSTSYSAYIYNGAGSGRYPVGSLVNITANAAPLGKVFDRWTGDVKHLSSATAASTAFPMPSTDIWITATYKDATASVPTAVTGLSLLNADNGQPISGFNPIQTGATLNLATLPTRRLSVRANTNPTTVGSVKFVYTGGSRVESTPPYTMTGTSGTTLTPWTPAVGSFTVTATPYSEENAAGAAGTSHTVNLTIIDSGATTTSYNAYIYNGSGSGAYPAGTNVTITANAAPVGQVFDRWTGDVKYLTTTTSSSTTFKMPAAHLWITATYKNSGTSTPPPPPPPGPGSGSIPEEQNGFLRVEAESFVAQEKTDNRRWYVTSTSQTPNVTPDGDANHASTASGRAYLEILPDTRRTHSDQLITGVNYSNTPGQAAVLKYTVRINNPGRYYVWVRAFSTGSEDNGIHVGLNGNWPASGARMQWCDGKNTWFWNSAQRTAAVHCGVAGLIYLDIPSAGTHTITFSMREDGFEFDSFILTKQQYMPRPTN